MWENNNHQILAASTVIGVCIIWELVDSTCHKGNLESFWDNYRIGLYHRREVHRIWSKLIFYITANKSDEPAHIYSFIVSSGEPM